MLHTLASNGEEVAAKSVSENRPFPKEKTHSDHHLMDVFCTAVTSLRWSNTSKMGC